MLKISIFWSLCHEADKALSTSITSPDHARVSNLGLEPQKNRSGKQAPQLPLQYNSHKRSVEFRLGSF